MFPDNEDEVARMVVSIVAAVLLIVGAFFALFFFAGCSTSISLHSSVFNAECYDGEDVLYQGRVFLLESKDDSNFHFLEVVSHQRVVTNLPCLLTEEKPE